MYSISKIELLHFCNNLFSLYSAIKKGGDTLINKVILAGRISSDIDLKDFSDKLQIASFFLAVDRGKKKGAKESTVDFLRCKAFNRTATNIHSFCKKGSLICVTGQIHNNRYERDGQTRYSTEIVIESIKFLPSFGGNNKEKTPDETWDELSYDEKLIVINGYRAAKKEISDYKKETVSNVTTAQQERDSVTTYNQRWSTELNKDEKMSAEIQEQAEEIVQKFSGESSLNHNETTQNENDKVASSVNHNDSVIEDEDNDSSSEMTEEEITDQQLPF